MWYKNCYRRNLVDMHIEDWDESFLSEFDPEDYEADTIPNGTTGPGIIANATVTTYYYQNAVLDAFDAFLKLTETDQPPVTGGIGIGRG